jgi:hypothetical protein
MVLSGQKLVNKEEDDGTWLIGFTSHDLRHTGQKQRTLQTIDTPFSTRSLPMSPV